MLVVGVDAGETAVTVLDVADGFESRSVAAMGCPTLAVDLPSVNEDTARAVGLDTATVNGATATSKSRVVPVALPITLAPRR
jgi:hypothetical protein